MPDIAGDNVNDKKRHFEVVLTADCFHVLDHTPSSFPLRNKEAIYVQREDTSLNQQLHLVLNYTSALCFTIVVNIHHN